MNKMKAWQGSYGISQHDGIVSPAYFTFDLTGMREGYFHAAIRSRAYVPFFTQASDGVRIGQWDLSLTRMREITFLAPPLSEQAAIVRFLDHADRRIRRYISTKQKLIALLQEEKQAIINQAVTRGLDPNVPLKPSGVEWLGEVPEHWEVRRAKTLGRIRYGLGQPPRESAEGVPLIRATNVERGRIVEKDLIRVDPSDVPVGRDALLRAQEIIVVRSGAYTADSAIIPTPYEGAVTGYDMVMTIAGALPKFMAFALLASYLRDDQLIVASTRSAQPHLNAEELGASLVLVPPLAEQAAIVEHLDKATADIDAAIGRAPPPDRTAAGVPHPAHRRRGHRQAGRAGGGGTNCRSSPTTRSRWTRATQRRTWTAALRRRTMPPTDTSEHGLESIIVASLTGLPLSLVTGTPEAAERQAAYGGAGYVLGDPKDYGPRPRVGLAQAASFPAGHPTQSSRTAGAG